MKTRYALTHINKDGMRQLTRTNQGRNHFDTREDAEKYLGGFLSSNTERVLSFTFGPQAVGTFRIDPVECYDHGDAVGIYVEDKNAPFDRKFKSVTKPASTK